MSHIHRESECYSSSLDGLVHYFHTDWSSQRKHEQQWAVYGGKNSKGRYVIAGEL